LQLMLVLSVNIPKFIKFCIHFQFARYPPSVGHSWFGRPIFLHFCFSSWPHWPYSSQIQCFHIFGTLLYLVLSILLHFLSLKNRWSNFDSAPSHHFVWSIEMTILFVAQRTGKRNILIS
jgi:hypothetical protein